MYISFTFTKSMMDRLSQLRNQSYQIQQKSLIEPRYKNSIIMLLRCKEMVVIVTISFTYRKIKCKHACKEHSDVFFQAMIKDLRNRYRSTMMHNAHLDNEKQALQYQLENVQVHVFVTNNIA